MRFRFSILTVVAIVVILLSVISSGCGGPCDDSYHFDHYVKGLCVNTGGFDFIEEDLRESLNITETEFNKHFPGNPVELEKIFISENVKLHFVGNLGPGINTAEQLAED